MFKSIQYVKGLGYNPDTQKYKYLYKIIDDDFEEEIIGADSDGVADADVLAAVVINCYSKKFLPIAPNLVRLAQYLLHHHVYRYSISTLLSWWLKYLPEYKLYHEEVQKYLLLE